MALDRRGSGGDGRGRAFFVGNEDAVVAQPPQGVDGARHRPLVELGDEVRLGGAGNEHGVAALLELDSHRLVGLEGGQRLLVGHAGEPVLEGERR